MLKEIDPVTVKSWLDADKAVLIDIREADEYAREHILGAQLVPLSGFDPKDFVGESDKTGVFHCASGRRTAEAAQKILKTGFREIYHLDGGLAGWKEAKLPTHFDRKAPIALQRQVQIAAGALVVLGVLLAAFVSPWFALLSGFVGAGLVFAGTTGNCGMASLLAAMPWNRPTVPAA